MNKNRKRLKKTLVMIFALLTVFGGLSALSFPLKIVNYAIFTNKVNKIIRIAQVSDLHSEYYGENMEKLLDAIHGQYPDVVVLTGDIFDDKKDNGNTRSLLKELAKRYPCYYVSGNHEHHKELLWETARLEATQMGITVLEDEAVDFMGVRICGALSSDRNSSQFPVSVKTCAEKAGDGFNILLAHYPEKIDLYRSTGKFDLILTGHAHGGQWRLPNLINGLYAPDQGLFPPYAGGRYDFGKETMIVSRGLSRTKTKIPRIFNNPELVIIDIMPE